MIKSFTKIASITDWLTPKIEKLISEIATNYSNGYLKVLDSKQSRAAFDGVAVGVRRVFSIEKPQNVTVTLECFWVYRPDEEFGASCEVVEPATSVKGRVVARICVNLAMLDRLVQEKNPENVASFVYTYLNNKVFPHEFVHLIDPKLADPVNKTEWMKGSGELSVGDEKYYKAPHERDAYLISSIIEFVKPNVRLFEQSWWSTYETNKKYSGKIDLKKYLAEYLPETVPNFRSFNQWDDPIVNHIVDKLWRRIPKVLEPIWDDPKQKARVYRWIWKALQHYYTEARSKILERLRNLDEDEKLVRQQQRLRMFSSAKAAEIYVWDLITDEMLPASSVVEALSIAKTQLGYAPEQMGKALFLKQGERYVSFENLFGELDFSKTLDTLPEFTPQRDPDPDMDAINDVVNEAFKPFFDNAKKAQEGEEWKKEGSLLGFTVEAAPWTDQELQVLKTVYLEARNKGIPHNLIYQRLSDFVPHSKSGIKQKLEGLYKADEELGKYKFEHWSREKIVNALSDLYRTGQPVSRKALPPKLEYQITNHSLPKAITRGFEVYFDSFDHAIAEAIAQVGFARNSEGIVDSQRPIASLEEAWRYYRTNEKQNNPWTKDEIIDLFKRAHAKGLPLTKSFFTSHQEVYKPLLEVSRSLDGLRKSIDRLGMTWGDLVMSAVPDYISWYNEDGKAKNSTGELRVIRFLDLNNIPYRRTSRKDKIPVTELEIQDAGYRNFIPDLYILDKDGKEVALVEIYGAIANSGAASGELAQKYHEKIKAKEQVYSGLPLGYVAIHDNELFGCDLSDEKLKEKFALFMKSDASTIDESR